MANNSTNDLIGGPAEGFPFEDYVILRNALYR